jgi:hypothetical protein
MLRKPLIYGLATFAVTFCIAAVVMPATLIEYFRGGDYEGWRAVPGAKLDAYLCPAICAATAAWIGWNRRHNSQD